VFSCLFRRILTLKLTTANSFYVFLYSQLGHTLKLQWKQLTDPDLALAVLLIIKNLTALVKRETSLRMAFLIPETMSVKLFSCLP
jgi:hypothetical protein